MAKRAAVLQPRMTPIPPQKRESETTGRSTVQEMVVERRVRCAQSGSRPRSVLVWITAEGLLSSTRVFRAPLIIREMRHPREYQICRSGSVDEHGR